MIDFISSLGESISGIISDIFLDDSGSLNIYGFFLVSICVIAFLLLVILKVCKFFSLFCKDESSLQETVELKKVDFDEPFVSVSSHKIPLVSHFSCVYCGSISKTNLKNCRNCGSVEFFKVGN